jgi:DNA (cytosine-5)-methyltransferase 1
VWRILDAQYFGLAQRRQRVFAVASFGGGDPAAVLFERKSLRGNYPPSREARQGTADRAEGSTPNISKSLKASDGGIDREDGHTLIAGAVSSKWSKQAGGPAGDECYNLVADPIQANEAKTYSLAGNNPRPRNVIPMLEVGCRTGRDGHEGRDGMGIGEPGDPMFSLQSSKQHGVLAFAENSRAEVRIEGGDGSTVGSLKVGGGKPGQSFPAVAFQTRYARNGRGAPEAIAAPLTAEAGRTGKGDSAPCVAFKTDQDPEAHGDVAPTLQQPSPTGGGQPTAVLTFKPSHYTRDKDGAPSDMLPPLSADADKGDQDPIVQVGAAVRRLTPVECSRLQGFSDDYLNITYRGRLATDSPKYRALGNSMAVPVIRWVLQRIEHAEKNNG